MAKVSFVDSLQEVSKPVVAPSSTPAKKEGSSKTVQTKAPKDQKKSSTAAPKPKVVAKRTGVRGNK